MAKKKNKTKYIIGAVVIFAVLAIVLMLYENSGDISGQAIKATKVTSVARAGDLFNYVDVEDISAYNKRDMTCAQVCTSEFADEYPSVKCAFAILEYEYSIEDDSGNQKNMNMNQFDHSCSYTISTSEYVLGTFENNGYFGKTFFSRLLCACYTG